MTTIKLDFDKKEFSWHRINKVILLLRLDITDVSVEKSKHGWHITLNIKNKMNDHEIVCVQSLMGSDYKRECFNLLRVHSGKFPNQSWNVLFKKKFNLVIPKSI